MSNILIYKEDRQSLSEIAFIKDSQHHVKIREINNSYEGIKQLSIIISEAFTRSGVKGDITTDEVKEIKECIFMFFKALSLDEVAYAFKLERFGRSWLKTEHFQLFNATYVGNVLGNYVEWKKKVKIEHNISAKKDPNEPTEEQIRFLENRAVTKAIQLFEETQNVTSDYTHLYEFFLEKGFINPTNEEKKKYYEDSKEILEMELKELKPTSREESKEIKNFLAGLQKNKNPKVISKSKELIVTAYFRKLRRENELENFKLKFKNQ